MRILLIHGRSQGGKDPNVLKDIWVKTLEKGFESCGKNLPQHVKFDFPFYGDRLDEFTSQANLPSPSDVQSKGPGQDSEFEAFMQSTLSDIKAQKNISDSDVEAEMDEPNVLERGPQNWDWVRALARVIDRNLTDTSDFTIETFLKDVYLYVNAPAVTKGINQIVENMLTGEPTIVIGHSLGSVVGYNVILENRERLDLRKYITVGSPLGISAISSKLGIPENPSSTGGWYNAYDQKDIVALNPLDNKYFPTDPEILNNNGVNNHTPNRHGIVGYLDDANVAQEVSAVLSL